MRILDNTWSACWLCGYAAGLVLLQNYDHAQLSHLSHLDLRPILNPVIIYLNNYSKLMLLPTLLSYSYTEMVSHIQKCSYV